MCLSRRCARRSNSPRHHRQTPEAGNRCGRQRFSRNRGAHRCGARNDWRHARRGITIIEPAHPKSSSGSTMGDGHCRCGCFSRGRFLDTGAVSDKLLANSRFQFPATGAGTARTEPVPRVCRQRDSFSTIDSTVALLQVILMSGYTDRMVGISSIGFEARFLQKPFSLDALARLTRSLLDTKRRSGEA